MNLLDEEDHTEIDPDKDYTPDLVGEDKKYKTIKDLAKAAIHKDAHIKNLEREKKELYEDFIKVQEESKTRAKLEELIDQVKNRKLDEESEHTQSREVTKPEFDAKDLESLVSTKIQEHEFNRKQQDNFNTVSNKLKEQYGNNYRNVLKDQMDQLGLTEEDVNSLARKSPAAFFRTMGLDQPMADTFQAPPRSEQRPGFKPNVQKRTWTWYENLRKSDPKSYHDPKTQLQMHKDYESLGASFEDGDTRLWKN